MSSARARRELAACTCIGPKLLRARIAAKFLTPRDDSGFLHYTARAQRVAKRGHSRCFASVAAHDATHSFNGALCKVVAHVVQRGALRRNFRASVTLVRACSLLLSTRYPRGYPRGLCLDGSFSTSANIVVIVLARALFFVRVASDHGRRIRHPLIASRLRLNDGETTSLFLSVVYRACAERDYRVSFE